MNKNTLFDIIGGISDDLIMEANNPVKRVKRVRISKTVTLAAAVIALLSITVFSSNRIISGTIGSSYGTNYYTVPSQKTLQKDIGISTNLVESFLNGYAFKNGTIVNNKDFDEDGAVFEKYKSLSCRYSLSEKSITLHIDASEAGIQMNNSEVADVYKESEIKYHAYTNKLVPGNYQLTEQDEKDKESGKYVFSFGSNMIEINEVQILGWEYHGLSYTFCAINNDITKDELVGMAKEIIDYQE